MWPNILIFSETENEAKDWAEEHNILVGQYAWFDANKKDAADHIGGLSIVIVLPQE